MLIEILFLASAFQCGSGADPAVFQLHATGGITLNEGEKAYVSVDSLQDLQFGYSVVSNGDCALEGIAPIGIEYGESLPTNDGVYDQPSLLELISTHVTEPYLSLALFEVGTTNPSSSAYDLQDLVVKINTNPTIYAD